MLNPFMLIEFSLPKMLFSKNVSSTKLMNTFNKYAVPEYLSHAFFIDGGALAVENALKAAFDWKFPQCNDLMDVIHLPNQFGFFLLQPHQLALEKNAVAHGGFQLFAGRFNVRVEILDLLLQRALGLVQPIVFGFQLGNRFLSLLDDRIRLGLQRGEGLVVALFLEAIDRVIQGGPKIIGC